MSDRFQSLMDEMDTWMARVDSDETTLVPRDELIQWHITLTQLYERWSSLQTASQAAVDAFLLRPSQEPPAGKKSSSGRPTGQRLYQRLAEAMAELEQVLIEIEASTD